MRRIALFALLISFSLPFAFSQQAHAQASRTWVSGVGDDANPCSRTAPCKTFAGAISKTMVNGEIDCLDPGGFGAVTITKSITFDCTGTFGSILYSGTNGVNIAFDSFAGTDTRKTVNIRGISFQGVDTGLNSINISGNGTGSFVNVEGCAINGNFGGTATGILDGRTNGTLTVLNTTIRNMGAGGVKVNSASASGLLRANLNNVNIVNAATGVSAGQRALVSVSNSIVASNATVGLIVSATSALDIDSTTISNNTLGVSQAGGSVNIGNNNFAFNVTGLSGTVNSYTNNRFNNNGGGGTITPIGTTTNPTGLQ